MRNLTCKVNRTWVLSTFVVCVLMAHLCGWIPQENCGGESVFCRALHNCLPPATEMHGSLLIVIGEMDELCPLHAISCKIWLASQIWSLGSNLMKEIIWLSFEHNKFTFLRWRSLSCNLFAVKGYNQAFPRAILDCKHRIKKSQNHRFIKVGKDLYDYQVQPSPQHHQAY